MCGLAGVINNDDATVDRKSLHLAAEAMQARGPDGEGVWVEDGQSAAFVHRRLAIIDLSENAAQPMLDNSERYVITFNGEIYNYKALREECLEKGYQFTTHSDTEVLLALYSYFAEDMLSMIRGMFAFAIYDRVEKQLFLARDHLGIKPLYYLQDSKGIKFCSSLNAMVEAGWIDGEKTSLKGKASFYNLGSIAEPLTCYESVYQLKAGSYAKIAVDFCNPISSQCYWSNADKQKSLTVNENHSINSAVQDSVSCHMESDVPVGVFLSAGIDSSVVATMMRRFSQQKIIAITLGFKEFDTDADEVTLAKEFAQRHGLEHKVYMLSKEEFIDDLPQFYATMEQPTIDALNVWFVAKAAKAMGIRVVLSGIGGDEVFGGYPSFSRIPKLKKWAFLFSFLPLTLLKKQFPSVNSKKLEFLSKYSDKIQRLFHLQRSIFMSEELSGKLLKTPDTNKALLELKNITQQEMYTIGNQCSQLQTISLLETNYYLRNQLLRDADWAGMAHSVEIRTPLVDYKLYESIYQLDDTVRFANGKSALAQLLDQEDRERIANRAKTGFILPMQEWLDESKAATHWSRVYADKVAEKFYNRLA